MEKLDVVIDNIISGVVVAIFGLAVNSWRKNDNKRYASLQQGFDDNFKRIENEMRENLLESKRNRILTLIYDDPHSHMEILDLFDEYEKLGGNGSTKERIIEWKKAEGLD